MDWYVIQAYSGYEAQVVRSLKERIVRLNLENMFGEIIVPSEEVIEVKEGKKYKSDRKFFPGYVLVEMEMDENSWHLVKSTPKVIGFIGGTADKPRPISKKEMDLVLDKIQKAEEGPKLKIIYDIGEQVRVIDGPFKDFYGYVEEVIANKGRLKVAIMIFGRSTSVDLEFNQVEKIV